VISKYADHEHPGAAKVFLGYAKNQLSSEPVFSDFFSPTQCLGKILPELCRRAKGGQQKKYMKKNVPADAQDCPEKCRQGELHRINKPAFCMALCQFLEVGTDVFNCLYFFRGNVRGVFLFS
jgi:hypothetical protein